MRTVLRRGVLACHCGELVLAHGRRLILAPRPSFDIVADDSHDDRRDRDNLVYCARIGARQNIVKAAAAS